MPEKLTTLEFAVDDLVHGQPLTPETVDLPTLRGFLEDVETLIKGNHPGTTLADSRVQVKEGSLKLVTAVGALLAAEVQADLEKLESTGNLDTLHPKRAEVIERWQTRARRSPSRIYWVPLGDGSRFRISNESRLEHFGEKEWVRVEKNLVGRVVDLGGKQNPNVHLVLPGSGKSLRVNATEEQIGAEEKNQVFKDVMLQIEAEQHLRTGELRNLRLIRFLPYTAEVDEEALARLWQKGREAWKDVGPADKWVEELRGH